MKNLFMFDAGYIGNEPAPKPVKPKRVLPAAWEAFNKGDHAPLPGSVCNRFTELADAFAPMLQGLPLPELPLPPVQQPLYWFGVLVPAGTGVPCLRNMFKPEAPSWVAESQAEAEELAAELKLEVGARVRLVNWTKCGELVEKTSFCVVLWDDGKRGACPADVLEVIPRDLPLGWHRIKVGEAWPEFGRDVRVATDDLLRCPDSIFKASDWKYFLHDAGRVRYWAELPENGGGPK